eukprot:1732842-Amphidinium_carterae.1
MLELPDHFAKSLLWFISVALHCFGQIMKCEQGISLGSKLEKSSIEILLGGTPEGRSHSECSAVGGPFISCVLNQFFPKLQLKMHKDRLKK